MSPPSVKKREERFDRFLDVAENILFDDASDEVLGDEPELDDGDDGDEGEDGDDEDVDEDEE